MSRKQTNQRQLGPDATAADTSWGERTLLVVGVALMLYTLAGNWLVLPGYRRFLEHGSPGRNAAGVDWALIWGASRTILWMLSFHLGASCLAWLALRRVGASQTLRRCFAAGALVWIAIWCLPQVPGPYTAYFATLGALILAAIVGWFLRARAASPDRHWLIVSFFFFALATWDVCGLGSVGCMLRPEGHQRAASQDLMVAQTSKLILELLFAWVAGALSLWRRR